EGEHGLLGQQAEVFQGADDSWHVCRGEGIAAGAIADRVRLVPPVEHQAPPTGVEGVLRPPDLARQLDVTAAIDFRPLGADDTTGAVAAQLEDGDGLPGAGAAPPPEPGDTGIGHGIPRRFALPPWDVSRTHTRRAEERTASASSTILYNW